MEVPAESLFCPYCGEKQEVIPSHGNDNDITTEQVNEGDSIHSSQSSSKTKASSVADEIMANLKMIGLAVLLCSLYIGVFWINHIDDRRPISDFRAYGSSCYDAPIMHRSYELNEEEIYKRRIAHREECIHKLEKDLEKSGIYDSNFIDEYRSWHPSDEELMNQAKEEASRNKEQMFSDIYEYRLFAAKEDFKEHLKYGILISFALTIFGRYLIKGIKWVARNKTK